MDILSQIQNAWGWVGIDPAEVISCNEFGNLIVKDLEGKYWRICPEEASCDVVAKDQDQWEMLSRDQEFIDDWNMSELVDVCNKSLGSLDKEQVYHLVIPSVLGGPYDISNIKKLKISELIDISGSIGEQIRDVPDGEQVSFKVID